MKYLLMTLISFFSVVGHCETIQLPVATVNQDILGGRLLLIKMKAYVAISGQENQAVETELGADLAAQFFHDIVMTKSVPELESIYNPSGDKETVQVVISRYSDTLLKIESKPNLN